MPRRFHKWRIAIAPDNISAKCILKLLHRNRFMKNTMCTCIQPYKASARERLCGHFCDADRYLEEGVSDLLEQTGKVRLEVIRMCNLPAEARRKSASDMGFMADFLNEAKPLGESFRN